MHHRIHSERQIEFTRPARSFDLLRMGVAEAGDAIRDIGFAALEADLDMAQSGVSQRRQLVFGQQHG